MDGGEEGATSKQAKCCVPYRVLLCGVSCRIPYRVNRGLYRTVSCTLIYCTVSGAVRYTVSPTAPCTVSCTMDGIVYGISVYRVMLHFVPGTAVPYRIDYHDVPNRVVYRMI